MMKAARPSVKLCSECALNNEYWSKQGYKGVYQTYYWRTEERSYILTHHRMPNGKYGGVLEQ